MGAIGGFLGLNGGAGGTGFSGPAQADQTGMNNLQNSYNQLQGVANGTGPNPAMAQYNQNVQNLAKQQSGALASVQGISPALATRMISQQGSGAMQNAAAQGATMQAQQQLGAMGQMGNLAGMQAGAANQMQGNINNNNMGLATTSMGAQQGLMGGILGGAGAAMMLADGGQVNGADAFSFGQPSQGPTSSFGNFMSSMSDDMSAPGGNPLQTGMTQFGKGLGTLIKGKGAPENMGQGPTAASAATAGAGIPYAQPMAMGFAGGGNVPALVSPGEVYIPPGKIKSAAKSANPLTAGKKIPGKPKVPGNSYANDTVRATLKSGGVVIPNSIMQSNNPAQGAHDMIAGIIANRKARK